MDDDGGEVLLPAVIVVGPASLEDLLNTGMGQADLVGDGAECGSLGAGGSDGVVPLGACRVQLSGGGT